MVINSIDFKPQYAMTLSEQIERHLISSIMEGKYEPGERIVENQLIRELGVSRSPIREAFKSLVKIGLLVNVARNGTYVKNITEKDIREKFPVRAHLEGFAAFLATQHMGPDEINALEKSLEKMQFSSEKKDFKSYTEYHNRFHIVFIKGCKNDTLINIINTLRQDILWIRFSFLWHTENHADALPMHQEILKLFIEKEAQAVQEYVRYHIAKNMESYIDFLSSRKMLEK